MAQSGYTPIQLYHSTTVSNTPTAGNLAPGELAINTAYGNLFYYDSGGFVHVIATKAGANGDVVGPASATDGNLAAFDGVTGKLIKQAATVTAVQGGTGVANNAANTITFSGAFGITMTLTSTTAITFPTSGTLATLAGTETLTNKRVTQRVNSITDAATITPTGDSSDQYNVTALAQPATVAAPSGTPTSGQKLILRIKDNGTGRALTWTTTSGAYRAVGVTLPTTTTANKTSYIGCIYNSDATFWDVVAVTTEV